eukprot:TRINITY_DN455_c2_g3_i2.p1 TRINITY_DN455_c2_g3~~TRINITY_DN455_c2_g3_i2.p1  ORF type:complete len:1060 (+),score=194.63 TRINITY_DN455_c2_g3_i2:199-3180(+)
MTGPTTPPAPPSGAASPDQSAAVSGSASNHSAADPPGGRGARPKLARVERLSDGTLRLTLPSGEVRTRSRTPADAAAGAAPAPPAAPAGAAAAAPAPAAEGYAADWVCPKCNFQNWGWKKRTACYDCREPAPKPQDDMKGYEARLRQTLLQAYGHVDAVSFAAEAARKQQAAASRDAAAQHPPAAAERAASAAAPAAAAAAPAAAAAAVAAAAAPGPGLAPQPAGQPRIDAMTPPPKRTKLKRLKLGAPPRPSLVDPLQPPAPPSLQPPQCPPSALSTSGGPSPDTPFTRGALATPLQPDRCGASSSSPPSRRPSRLHERAPALGPSPSRLSLGQETPTPREYRGGTVEDWRSNLSRARSNLEKEGRRARKNQRQLDRVAQLSLSELAWDAESPIGTGAYGHVYRCWVRRDAERAAREGRPFPGRSELMALKVIELDDGGCNETFQRNRLTVGKELQSWQAIWVEAVKGRRGSHLVQPLKPYEDARHFYMLMEFMHFGSLDDLMKAWAQIPRQQALDMFRSCGTGAPADGGILGRLDGSPADAGGYHFPPYARHTLPEVLQGYILRHVLMGLDFIHRLTKPAQDGEGAQGHWCHLDVKPGNILIDNWAGVKIGDFGLMSFADGGRDEGGGTRTYMAPERVRGDHECTPAADVWSLGVTELECALGLHSECGVRLFSAAGRSSWAAACEFDAFCSGSWGAETRLSSVLSWEAVLDTIQAEPQLRASYSQLSEDLVDFCRNCLSFDRRCRPTAARLLVHEFVMTAWDQRQTKQLLDGIVGYFQMKDKLAGKHPPRWADRGWQPAGRSAADASSLSASTVTKSTGVSSRSDATPCHGSGLHGRRRSRPWRGDWAPPPRQPRSARNLGAPASAHTASLGGAARGWGSPVAPATVAPVPQVVGRGRGASLPPDTSPPAALPGSRGPQGWDNPSQTGGGGWWAGSSAGATAAVAQARPAPRPEPPRSRDSSPPQQPPRPHAAGGAAAEPAGRPPSPTER